MARPSFTPLDFGDLIAGRKDEIRLRPPGFKKYSMPSPWPDSPPTIPWLVYIGDGLRFRCWAFDFDGHDGPESLASAASEALEARSLLLEVGIIPVIGRSGPDGGRHLKATFRELVPADLTGEVARRVKLLFPSLDISPMCNARTGGVRPFGAPHPSGRGASAVLEEFHSVAEAYRILKEGHAVEAAERLRESLPALPARTVIPLSGAPGDRAVPSGRGRLTYKMTRLLENGEATNDDQSASGLVHAAVAMFEFHGWAEDEAFEMALGSAVIGPLLEARPDPEGYWHRSWLKGGEGFASKELCADLAEALARSRRLLVAGALTRAEHEVHGELLRLGEKGGTSEPYAEGQYLCGVLCMSVGWVWSGLAGLQDKGVLTLVEPGQAIPGGKASKWGLVLPVPTLGFPIEDVSCSRRPAHEVRDCETTTMGSTGLPGGVRGSETRTVRPSTHTESPCTDANPTPPVSWAQKLELITSDPLPYWHPVFRDRWLGEKVWRVDCALRIHREAHWSEVAKTAGVGKTTGFAALASMADEHMARRLGGGVWRRLPTEEASLDLIFRRMAAAKDEKRRAGREAKQARARESRVDRILSSGFIKRVGGVREAGPTPE